MNIAVKTTARPKPFVLCILDGWGHRTETADNAIALARLPTWTRLLQTCPHALVETSGLDVGLPPGQMGNSEVGHMNIGAGRVIMQDLPRIDAAVADGSIAKNPVLLAHIAKLKASGGACHMIGLVSTGGVHSHQDHMVAVARILDAAGIPVRLHAMMDGRDSPPQSGRAFMEKLLRDLSGLARTQVVTVGGRYFGMDRDRRWERVAKAYAAIAEADGQHAPTPLAAITASYDAHMTDEFMLPTVIGGYNGMKDGDGVFITNFRADRIRQLIDALIEPTFAHFARRRILRFAAATGLTEYGKARAGLMTAMFPAERSSHTLGEVLSRAGLTQLRIAETEKYAHVTYFLNGGAEQEYPGETRILVPSPKVATYDLQPEMSAQEVTDKIVEAIAQRAYDVIIVNYANGDMVGHTGILPAAIKAAETVDICLARLEKALKETGGAMLICADHGNLEMMRDTAHNQPHTQHTTGAVPVVLVNGPAAAERLRNGRLADIAPTVLDLLKIATPREMTGLSLVKDRDRSDSEGDARLASA